MTSLQITATIIAAGILIGALLILIMTFLVHHEPYKSRWEALKKAVLDNL